MSHLLIVIKSKRQFLIVSENLIAHIPLDTGPHNMSIISNIKITKRLHQHQQDHKNPQFYDHAGSHFHRQIYNVTGDIPDNERDYQRNGRPQYGEKHIRKEQPFIRLIISGKVL